MSLNSTIPYIPWTAELGESQMMPVMVGTLFSSLGLGIVWTAAAGYYMHYPRDSWFNKTFVTVILSLTTADTICGMIRITRSTGPFAGNYAYFVNMIIMPEAWLNGVFAMLTESVCDLFMIIRIIRFARALRRTYGNNIKWFVNGLSIFFGIVWLFDVVVGLAPAILLGRMGNLLDVMEGSKPTELFHLLLNAQISTFMILDFIITISMFLELRLARSGWAGSYSVIDTLITLGLRTGLLVFIIQTIELTLSYVSPTSWFDFPILILGKVRALTVLAIIIAPRRAHEAYHSQQETQSRPSGIISHPSIPSMANAEMGRGETQIISATGTTTSHQPLMAGVAGGLGVGIRADSGSSSASMKPTTPKDFSGEVLHVSYSPPTNAYHRHQHGNEDEEKLDEKDFERFPQSAPPLPPLPVTNGGDGWLAGARRKASVVSMSLVEMLSSSPGDDEEMMRDVTRNKANMFS